MEIEYLKMLRDNPAMYPNDIDYKGEIRGIPLTEIEQLEQTWNNGNPFPKALRELLFLAGEFCYVFSYGISTQQALQQRFRMQMEEENRVLNKPFYVMDIWGPDQFYFVYLDEGDNPYIYEAIPYENKPNWFKKTDFKIKSKSEHRIARVKRGENPY
jgi:hypothetical protein